MSEIEFVMWNKWSLYHNKSGYCWPWWSDSVYVQIKRKLKVKIFKSGWNWSLHQQNLKFLLQASKRLFSHFRQAHDNNCCLFFLMPSEKWSQLTQLLAIDAIIDELILQIGLGSHLHLCIFQLGKFWLR